MTNWGYIVIGWGATGGILGLYALRVVTRGKILSRQVPEERRRWMS